MGGSCSDYTTTAGTERLVPHKYTIKDTACRQPQHGWVWWSEIWWSESAPVTSSRPLTAPHRAIGLEHEDRHLEVHREWILGHTASGVGLHLLMMMMMMMMLFLCLRPC